MQVANFTALIVKYVQIMRCSCDWTTRCFNAVFKHENTMHIKYAATAQKQINAYSYIYMTASFTQKMK